MANEKLGLGEKTVGQEIIEGLKEAIEFQKGKKTLRTQTVTVPPPAKEWSRQEIVHIRKEIFDMSQAVFASLLNASAATIRAWEQGLKKPSAVANRLLELAAFDPSMFERLAETAKAKANARKAKLRKALKETNSRHGRALKGLAG